MIITAEAETQRLERGARIASLRARSGSLAQEVGERSVRRLGSEARRLTNERGVLAVTNQRPTFTWGNRGRGRAPGPAAPPGSSQTPGLSRWGHYQPGPMRYRVRVWRPIRGEHYLAEVVGHHLGGQETKCVPRPWLREARVLLRLTNESSS